MGSLRIPLAVALTSALLLACGGEPSTPAAKPASVEKAAVKPAPAAPPLAAAAPAPPAFIYSPVDLRDPFEPFVKLEEKKKLPIADPGRSRPPLQRFPIEQLTLVGVVWGENGKARALIQDPQGKGYVVGVGTRVGDKDGKIARIQPDRVVIEERFTDLFGEEKKNVTNMMLRKPEGEVGP
jgi:type IV pilus assembly protein PilP